MKHLKPILNSGMYLSKLLVCCAQIYLIFLQRLYKRAKLNLLHLIQLLFCVHVVSMLSDMYSCCLKSYVGNFCMEKMILIYRLALHNDALPTAHVDKQVESAMVSARS